MQFVSQVDWLYDEETEPYDCEKLVTAALDRRPSLQRLFREPEMTALVLSTFPTMTNDQRLRLWQCRRWRKVIAEHYYQYDSETRSMINQLPGCHVSPNIFEAGLQAIVTIGKMLVGVKDAIQKVIKRQKP